MVPRSIDLEGVEVLADYFGLEEMKMEVVEKRREETTEERQDRHTQIKGILTQIRDDVQLLTQQRPAHYPTPRPPPPPFPGPGPDPDFPRPPPYFGNF